MAIVCTVYHGFMGNGWCVCKACTSRCELATVYGRYPIWGRSSVRFYMTEVASDIGVKKWLLVECSACRSDGDGRTAVFIPCSKRGKASGNRANYALVSGYYCIIGVSVVQGAV